MPESLLVIFDLKVNGHANSYIVNNVSRALVDRLTVKFAGEIMQETDGHDLFKLYEDLFLTKMRGCACSVKEFSLLTFQRSVAVLGIRRNQVLQKRISSMMFIRTNIGSIGS